MDTQARQEPIADQRADNANAQIGDEAVTGAAHQVSGKPAGDQADHENNEETFTRHEWLPF